MPGIGTAVGRRQMLGVRRILGLFAVAVVLSTVAVYAMKGPRAPVAAIPASCREEAESSLVSFVRSTFTDCRTLSNAAVAGVGMPWIMRTCLVMVGASGRIEDLDTVELRAPVCRECQTRLEALGATIGPNGRLDDDPDSTWALRRLVREYQFSRARHVPLPALGS
jgi:hypothetical protein